MALGFDCSDGLDWLSSPTEAKASAGAGVADGEGEAVFLRFCMEVVSGDFRLRWGGRFAGLRWKELDFVGAALERRGVGCATSSSSDMGTSYSSWSVGRRGRRGNTRRAAVEVF